MLVSSFASHPRPQTGLTQKCRTYERFAEHHSFNVDVLGFIQLLYDTTCLHPDFWVKPVWGLGCSSFKETACLCTNPHLLLKDSLDFYEHSELRPAGCGGESFSPIFPICEYFYQSEQQAAVWLLQHLMLIFYVCRLKDHSDTGKYF